MCVGRDARRSSPSSPMDTGTLKPCLRIFCQWIRTFRQPMKPMLPRKLTSTARINLNQYWNILEELVPCEVTMDIQDGDVDMSNEINENLANERLEQSRDISSTCQGGHQESGVEIVVSLDTSALWEDSANCANSLHQERDHST